MSRGAPESPLRWSRKSTHALAAELFAQHGIRISDKTVANKAAEGKQHPDRNAQFEHIMGACKL